MLSLTAQGFGSVAKPSPLHGINWHPRRRSQPRSRGVDLSSVIEFFCTRGCFIDVVRKFSAERSAWKAARPRENLPLPSASQSLGPSCCQGPLPAMTSASGMHFRMNVVADHTFDQPYVPFQWRRFHDSCRAFERSSGTYDIWKPDWRACAWKSPFCLRRRR